MTNPDQERKEHAPRDAKIIEEILKSMGVQSWEPRVVNQLMEFLYRYTSEVLQEAQVYSEYSGRQHVEVDDVKLAVRAVCSKSFTTPPSREVLRQLSQARNSIPLKPIEGRTGLRLPPEEFTLTTPGWQVRLPQPVAESFDTAVPMDMGKSPLPKALAKDQPLPDGAKVAFGW
eukprot:CAMPEP_0118930126 /NCGR_PEP_ID=MMETSP1169-20130426/6920_1 /TAXON_ID=36882 /ORGANISM="Pyramimonas obovata, Strain CCMP722" /LENGTH=172 /DNA_ID=CAMNT_0006872439 /DNA_START=240 /DNA_END=755 /DNA_ORIENTATION=+